MKCKYCEKTIDESDPFQTSTKCCGSDKCVSKIPTTYIAGKTLGNTCANGATKNVSDIVFWGDGDTFKLISKASSQKEGWMKSTKAMDCHGSVVVQVTTQQRNHDGSYSIAEALTTVLNAGIVEVKDDDGIVISRRVEDFDS